MNCIYLSLPEKCLDTEVFLVLVFSFLVFLGIRTEHGDNMFLEYKHAHNTLKQRQ